MRVWTGGAAAAPHEHWRRFVDLMHDDEIVRFDLRRQRASIQCERLVEGVASDAGTAGEFLNGYRQLAVDHHCTGETLAVEEHWIFIHVDRRSDRSDGDDT